VKISGFIACTAICLSLFIGVPGLMAADEKDVCKGIDVGYIAKHMPLPQFNIEATKGVRGLCEVVINVEGELLPLYAQKDKELLIAGDMFHNKTHVTRDTLDNLQAGVFRKAISDINDVVAFFYKPKEISSFVYLFTDPDCAYCDQAKEPLKKWADENKVEVRVILFPLPMHPGAKAKAVAAVCSKMTYEAYLGNKYATDGCSAGEEKISKALILGQGLGVAGTPTFVGPTGKTAVGFDPEELKGIL